MRYFLIFICFIPFCLNGQIIINDTIVSIDNIKNKGCDCKIKTDIIKEKVINTIDTIQNEELIACCYHCLAIYYHSRVENYLESISHHKKALKIRNEYQKDYIWKSHYGLALAYDKLNMPYQAEEHFREAISRVNDVKRERDSINIFRSFADNLTKIGEIEEAVYWSKEAIKVNANNRRLATAYNTTSKVHTENTNDTIMYKEAVAYSDTAIVLLGEPHEPRDSATMAKIYNNKARAFGLLARHIEAIQIYKQSLQIRPEYDVLGKAQVINNIGVALHEQKKYEEAIDKFKQSLQLKKSHHNNALYHRDYAINYENLAGVYKMLNQINRSKKVIGHYQLALINLTNNFRNPDINTNPTIAANHYIYNKPDLLRVLDLKAQAALKAKKIDLAHNTYQALDNWINEFYKDLSTNESKLTWIDRAHDTYAHAIEVALAKSDNEKAFQYAERAHAVLLWQSLSRQAAQSLLSPENIEVQDSLTALIRQTDYQYRNAKEGEKATLKNKIDELEEAFEQFENTLDGNLEYKNRKYQTNSTSVSDIQGTLNRKTALIEYYLTDDSLHIFTITKSGLKVSTKPNDGLAEDIKQVVSMMKDGNSKASAYSPLAYELYQKLIPEHIQNTRIKHLIIIPDKEIGTMPFAALPIQETTKDFSKDYPFLVKKYSTNYLYSYGSFQQLQQDNQQYEDSNKLAVIAPVEFYNPIKWKSLGSPDNQVGKLKKMYGKSTKVLKGKVATKEAAIAILEEGYETVQLNTHAEYDGKSGQIIFRDTSLTQSEIDKLEVNVNRLILAACQTAEGEQNSGEGILSLGWNFAYKGVPSITMTQWSVDDAATRHIMTDYHEALIAKTPADQALQNAQIKYLNSDDAIYKHPSYWSAIIHTGNPGDSSGSRFWLWALVILLLGVAFYILKKRQNEN